MTEEDRKRLGGAIQARRGQLRMKQVEFAVLAGITPKQLSRIEAGKVEPRVATLDGLDVACDWPAGTSLRILQNQAAPAAPVAPETDARIRRLAKMTRAEIIAAAEAIEKVDGEQAADEFIYRAYAAKAQQKQQRETTPDSSIPGP